MERLLLQPGFRFHPTDEELVGFYLKRKVLGRRMLFDVIAEVDLYKHAPWDLPEKSFLKSRDREWYFYCPRDRKYSNGPRTNRATETGYWKTTGKDRPVCLASRKVGMKKTLVFHIGRAPNGERTNWVMHEYRLEDANMVDPSISQDAFVLCRLFKKSGSGPKNGAQYGAPFKEEEWDKYEKMPGFEALILALTNQASLLPGFETHDTDTDVGARKDSGFLLGPDPQPSGISGLVESHNTLIENPLKGSDEIDNSMLEFDGANNNSPNMNMESPPKSAAEDVGNVDGYDIYKDLGDINSQKELEGVTDSYMSSNVEDEYGLPQMIPAMEEGSYLELNDLVKPVDSDQPSFEMPSDMFDIYDFYDNPTALGLFDSPVNLDAAGFCPNSENLSPLMMIEKNSVIDDKLNMVVKTGGVGDSFNWELQPEMAPSTYFFKNSDKTGAGCSMQNPATDSNHSEEEHYSIGHYLLGSIPARAASAAEYPSAVSRGKFVGDAEASRKSSIHVRTGMAVTHVKLEHDLLNKCGKSNCECCNVVSKADKKYVERKMRRADPKNGLTFVFILGAASALMWVFVFVIGIKIAGYGWNHLMP
ncbi:hypothetical protein AMTRI_Chr11g157280 [Amborella trichopoda]